MEIEILTTTRKINKSILSQLGSVTFSDMEIFNSLNSPGYYINTPKGRVFLVETHSGWKKLPEVTSSEYQLMSTNSAHIRNNSLKIYNTFVKKCKNHLII